MWVLLLRIAHGVGWGFASTAAGALVQDVVPPARRGEATGWYSNATDIAMAVGSVAAVAAWGWFGFAPLMAAVATMVAAAVSLLPLPEGERAAGPAPFLPAGALVQLLANLAFGTVMTFLPVIALERGLARPVAGVDGYAWCYMVYVATRLLIRRPVGRLVDRRGRGYAVVPGLAVLALAVGWLALTRH